MRSSAVSEIPISVALATMRPDYVRHLLDSYACQTWPEKQLLLGLHGFSMEDLHEEIRARARRMGTVVEWPRSALFGDLLRELTLRADGQLLAKMDDDDWYAPHHLEDLVHAIQYSGASLVGSGVQFVYLHNADVTIRRSADQAYRYGGHPGGPTFMALRSTILAAGNWPRVRRAVDTGLNDAIIELGGTVYQSHPHNFLFNRRSSGHTWKASNEYFVERAIQTWSGLRPPVGFDGHSLPDADWRSEASTLTPWEPGNGFPAPVPALRKLNPVSFIDTERIGHRVALHPALGSSAEGGT